MEPSLLKYKSLRNPKITSEPFTSYDIDPKKLVFVVQKHQATALHYDFRLELNGVMPSWAIPKGPSLDPAFKRLAMKTEDHPLDYRYFEGAIPAGEYGGGTVMVWDEGTYFPEVETSPGVRRQIKDKIEGERIMEESILNGEIKFFLKGNKIKGSFALVRIKGFSKTKESWLLIKHKDKYAKVNYDAKDFNFSAKSGKTLEEIASFTR